MLPDNECHLESKALRERVQQLLNEDCWIYIFYGWAGGVSDPPFRYLVLPGESPTPLFVLPDPKAVTPCVGGRLGSADFGLEDEEEIEPPEVLEEPDELAGLIDVTSELGEELEAYDEPGVDEEFLYDDDEGNDQ